tara:strand:- start:2189 stop:2872 length:684 start_codon:yes stop_codon:yes gene_type:complete
MKNNIVIYKMSNSALSAAKRRRGVPVNNNNNEEPSTSNNSIQPVDENKPISLQQALQLLSGRIIKLEKNIQETKNNEQTNQVIQNVEELNIETIVEKVTQSQIFEEFNARYEILASEILTLKHIVMKLQSYTLDINKTLVEERIQILSEIPEKGGISILEVKDDLNLRNDIENMIEESNLQDVLENDKELLKTQIENELNSENVIDSEDNKEIEVQENVTLSLQEDE